MNDIVEVKNDFKSELSLSGGDIQRTVDHLALVKEAVRKVMKEGIDNDFSVIPGTKKKSLLKPGAEKLMRLFGLGVKFKQTENIFDLVENFAMYSYEAEIYHLRTGTVIASCEATANSQEQKYKEKADYRGGVKVGVKPIPVADIINSLKKMAQKRAMVGAVIIAVGASDYFSQDEDEVQAQQATRKPAEKVDDSRFQQSDAGAYVMPVGPRKGKSLHEVGKEQVQKDLDYWKPRATSGPALEFVDRAREFLRGA